LTKDRYYVLVL